MRSIRKKHEAVFNNSLITTNDYSNPHHINYSCLSLLKKVRYLESLPMKTNTKV